MSRAGGEPGEGTDEPLPRDPAPPEPAPSEPLGPEPSDDEVERRFAALMAAFEADADNSGSAAGGTGTAVHPEAADPKTDPDAELATESPTETERDAPDTATEPPSSARLGPAPGPRDYALAPEPDEGFVPPDPEPLDGVDPLQLAAWIGAIVGPLAAIVLLVVWPSAPAPVWLTALGATLAGWGVVIWRLPRHRDGDDDGARV